MVITAGRPARRTEEDKQASREGSAQAAGPSFKHAVKAAAAYSLIAAVLSSANGLIAARLLGPAGKGDFAAVSAYFGMILLVFELGLASSVVYFVAKERDSRANIVRTALGALLPLGMLAALASEIFGLSLHGGTSDRATAFMILPVAILASFIGAPPTGAMQAIDINRWNQLRLAQPVVFLVLTVAAEFTTTLTVTLMVELLSASVLAQSAWSWRCYLRQKSGPGQFKAEFLGPMLRFGATNVAATAPNALNSRVDQLILAVMVPAAALGQYSVAVSISILATPLISAFGYVAFPKLARGENIRATIKATTSGSILLSVAMCGVVTAAGPWLIPRILGPAYHSVVVLLLILAPGAAVVGVNQVLGDLLRGLGRPGLVARCEWLGFGVTVAGMFLLVPRWGAFGAAVTSTVTYLVVFILLRLCLNRQPGCGGRHQAGRRRNQA